MYRAAFVPALLAAVLAMFSLESRPRPLPQGLAADVLFDGRLAAATATRIAERAPDRRPGSAGNLATADLVADGFRARGFPVQRERFSHAGRQLENVSGRRVGRSRRQIVVVAARDASVVPEAYASAADTAALLELARVFEGRPSQKTLVLASVDGSTLGQIGAARLAEELGSPEHVDAVLVMSNFGSPVRSGPLLQPWSNDWNRPGIELQRTVAESLREELGASAGESAALSQLARLSFPIGLGPQGVLLERGFDAVRISGSGELPPVAHGPRRIDEDRLGPLGRSVLRSVSAVDQRAALERGPDGYLLAVSQVLPGWALALLSGALLLPVIAVSVDAFARARRRGLDLTPWLRWLAAWTAPFLAGLSAAELLALAGATPAPAPAPVAPVEVPLDGAALAVLGGVAVAMGLGFALARFLAAAPPPARAEGAAPGAAVALALVISVGAAALWVANPYAALLAAPAAHLWTLAALTVPPPARRVRALLVALGALPVALVALFYLFTLDLDPAGGAWYLLLLVTGHSVGLGTALVAGLWLAVFCAAVELIARSPRAPTALPRGSGPPVYGPGSHAGPGSLGGTESALPR